jgi:hypothetical protein
VILAVESTAGTFKNQTGITRDSTI